MTLINGSSLTANWLISFMVWQITDGFRFPHIKLLSPICTQKKILSAIHIITVYYRTLVYYNALKLW